MSERETDADRKKPSNLRRAYRGYQAYTWAGRLGRLWAWATTQGASSVVIGTATVGVVAATAGMAVNDARVHQNRAAVAEKIAPAASNRALREELGRAAVVYGIRGFDKSGRFAEFDVIVLARDFTWVKGSADTMQRGSATLDAAAFAVALGADELGNRIARATDLIAVGLASAEGDRAQEEARATTRARTIAGALASVSRGAKTIWALDLGQYTGAVAPGADGTDWQRPILIIGLRAAAAGVDLGEALGDAMNGASNLPKTASYSRFELAKVK